MTTATPKETKATKPLDFKEIAQLGYLQKTKEIYNGLTVTLQTLSNSRHQKILSLLPADNSDALFKYTQLQVETLVYATLAINDEKFSEADIERLRKLYGEMQNRVLQEIYTVYQELTEEQDKVLTGLKKT